MIKTYDDRGRRQLSLSERKFMPLDGVNMSNVDETYLLQELSNYQRDSDYYKTELKEAQIRIKSLENERDNLQNTLETLMSALNAKGIDLDDIKEILQEK